MAPKKLDDVEADSLGAWSWTRDPALVAARAAQDEVEARLSEIEQDDQRRHQDRVAAATDALHIARARRAHGSGSDGEVKKAEAELENVRHRLEALHGERLELVEKRSRLREVAISETEKAQGRCCKRLRLLYVRAVRELGASLVDAQEKAVRVRELYPLRWRISHGRPSRPASTEARQASEPHRSPPFSSGRRMEDPEVG